MNRVRAAPVALLLAGSLVGLAAPAGENVEAPLWTAPDEAKGRPNPIPASPESMQSGKIVYEEYCLSCHGSDGKGKGPVAARLGFYAGDLTDSERMSAQTDGAIYWKIATGRDPMPAFKEANSLTDEQIWNAINFTRSFSVPPDQETPPGE